MLCSSTWILSLDTARDFVSQLPFERRQTQQLTEQQRQIVTLATVDVPFLELKDADGIHDGKQISWQPDGVSQNGGPPWGW